MIDAARYALAISITAEGQNVDLSKENMSQAESLKDQAAALRAVAQSAGLAHRVP